jgi:hypothetical protein
MVGTKEDFFFIVFLVCDVVGYIVCVPTELEVIHFANKSTGS